ncbi:MAG: MBOAT family protein [Nostocales cyanobacterium]|nr:MAG: MBOAT family protein [Nostocales cyanobacterium]TAF20431.1 MAG: MBOAT family protein [Nostocales cyanobacterium]
MLFNSSVFILAFLPITLLVLWLLSKFRLTKFVMPWLLVTSLFFYSYWNLFSPAGQAPTPGYIVLIILSLVFNHQMGEAIASAQPYGKRAKFLLIIGTLINVSMIAYYKYANFFLGAVGSLFAAEWNLGTLMLPLGISFYTFTQIAYLVDAYRGEVKGQKYDLIIYSVFILFFPQLIAGPILRHDELIPELRKLKDFVFSSQNFATGLTIFTLGLAKKIIIADTLSQWATPVFNNSESLTFIESWVGALSYTLQLYFDFSGYSDMAVGLGYMFNTNLPSNFNSPYKATSITDFWRRWHITLSNFLRDYLYIPLGGSRKGEIRRYSNLMITMLLGGLWHGAGWTFILWGGLQGFLLSINHGWRKFNIKIPALLAWVMTFLMVIVGWVIFRAQNLPDAITILKTMSGLNGIVIPGAPGGKLSMLSQFGIQVKVWSDLTYLPEFFGQKSLSFLLLFVLMIIVTFAPNTQEITNKITFNKWWGIGIGLLAGYCILSLNRVSEFLYFQF